VANVAMSTMRSRSSLSMRGASGGA